MTRKTSAFLPGVFLLAACGTPPPATPSLTPAEAAQLLHYNSKAEVWLMHAKKQNPSCEYKLDLPDQTAHPLQLDLDHIVWCGGRPGPLELSAGVTFEYDKASGHWAISRFSS